MAASNPPQPRNDFTCKLRPFAEPTQRAGSLAIHLAHQRDLRITLSYTLLAITLINANGINPQDSRSLSLTQVAERGFAVARHQQQLAITSERAVESGRTPHVRESFVAYG